MMNDLSDQLSNLFPPSDANQPQVPDATRGMLQALAGQSGGPLQTQISQFLSGKGELLNTTQKAAATGGDAAANMVAGFLTSTLKLSPAIANMIAPLLLSLLPSIAGQFFGGQSAETSQTTAKKPRKKASTSSTSKKKAETTTKPKTTGKKTTTKTKKVVSYSGKE